MLFVHLQRQLQNLLWHPAITRTQFQEIPPTMSPPKTSSTKQQSSLSHSMRTLHSPSPLTRKKVRVFKGAVCKMGNSQIYEITWLGYAYLGKIALIWHFLDNHLCDLMHLCLSDACACPSRDAGTRGHHCHRDSSLPGSVRPPRPHRHYTPKVHSLLKPAHLVNVWGFVCVSLNCASGSLLLSTFRLPSCHLALIPPRQRW